MSRLNSAFSPPELITAARICRRLGVSRWTWARWVRGGKAPAPVNKAGWPRWRRADIDRFAEGNFRGPGKRTYFTKARQLRNEQDAQQRAAAQASRQPHRERSDRASQTLR